MQSQAAPPGTKLVDPSVSRRLGELVKLVGGAHKVAPHFGCSRETLTNIIAGRPVRNASAIVVTALLPHVEKTIRGQSTTRAMRTKQDACAAAAVRVTYARPRIAR